MHAADDAGADWTWRQPEKGTGLCNACLHAGIERGWLRGSRSNGGAPSDSGEHCRRLVGEQRAPGITALVAPQRRCMHTGAAVGA
jgi:hypothetical protein